MERCQSEDLPERRTELRGPPGDGPRGVESWTVDGIQVLKIFFYQWLPANWENKRERWNPEHIYVSNVCESVWETES